MKIQQIIGLCMLILLNLSLLGQSIENVYQTTTSPLIYDIVNDIAIDNNGAIFIATEFGLSKLSTNNNWSSWNYPDDNLPEDVIRSVYNEPSNGMYIGGFLTGLTLYNNIDFEQISIPNQLDNFVRDMVSNEDYLYIATANGLGIYNKTSDVWSYINGDNSKISSSNISCLALGSNNQLYAGTINGGLLQIEQNTITNFYGEADGLPDNTVLDIAIDKNTDEIWLATPAAGIVYFNGTNFENINKLNSALPSNNLTAVAIADNSAIWFGSSNNGVIILKDTVFEHFNTTNSIMPSNQINHIEIKDTSTIWVATNNGLVKFTNDISIGIDQQSTNTNPICKYNFIQNEIILNENLSCTNLKITDMNGSAYHFNSKKKKIISLNNFTNGHYVICCQTTKNYICQRIFLFH